MLPRDLAASAAWLRLARRLLLAEAVSLEWRRLLRKLRRLRRLQRAWAHLGQYLQQYPGWLRRRLRRLY